MAIEKQILSAVPELQEEIDIEILPEMEEETEVFIQPDGSAILGSEMPDQASLKFGENLAETLDERELNTIASELVNSYEEDLESRQDWFDTYVDGLDLLGINAENR